MIASAVLRRLRDAPWLAKPETQTLFDLLDGKSGRTRAVGGVVRDTLIGGKASWAEVDLATELTPDEVVRRAAGGGIASYPTGIEHGTVTLRLGDLTAEVTTLREDVETDGRHARVVFGIDWRRDAERRDFTLNALYCGMTGELFDPIGGLDDCLAGIVRFIGDPDRRIAEDRLRVYRFFRFTASHGHEQFDADGLAATARASGDLSGLSAERVGNEMRRILSLPSVARTLKAMIDARVLKFSSELAESLAAYERHAPQPRVGARLAIILSSLGEGALREMWRLSNDEVAGAASVFAAAGLLIEFRVEEAAYRYPAALSDAVDVAATLAGWTEAGKSAVVQHLGRVDVPTFPVTGRDLLTHGFAPGPALGAELERLEALWIASSFALGRAELLAAARR